MIECQEDHVFYCGRTDETPALYPVKMRLKILELTASKSQQASSSKKAVSEVEEIKAATKTTV